MEYMQQENTVSIVTEYLRIIEQTLSSNHQTEVEDQGFSEDVPLGSNTISQEDFFRAMQTTPLNQLPSLTELRARRQLRELEAMSTPSTETGGIGMRTTSLTPDRMHTFWSNSAIAQEREEETTTEYPPDYIADTSEEFNEEW